MNTVTEPKKKSRRARVLEMLLTPGWHWHNRIAEVGGRDYRTRICELKRQGYQIESERIPVKGGHRYHLKSPVPEAPPAKRVRVLINEGDAEKLCNGVVTQEAKTALLRALNSHWTNRNR